MAKHTHTESGERRTAFLTDAAQTQIRKTGSKLMRHGLNVETFQALREALALVQGAKASDVMTKEHRILQQLLPAVPTPRPPRDVNDRVRAKVFAKAATPKNIGSRTPSRVTDVDTSSIPDDVPKSAQVWCKCGWWAANDAIAKGVKHASKKGDGHDITQARRG